MNKAIVLLIFSVIFLMCSCAIIGYVAAQFGKYGMIFVVFASVIIGLLYNIFLSRLLSQ